MSKERDAIDWLTTRKLDLGIALVDVEVAQLDSNLWAKAIPAERKIQLCRELEGEHLAQTLWHEVLHILDALVCRGTIEGLNQGSKENHPGLDVLASLIDNTLRRNWLFWARVYGPPTGPRKLSKPQPKRPLQPRNRRRT